MMEPNDEQPYAPPIILPQGMARTKRPVQPDEREMLDDDSLFERRKPSSTRVYHRSRHAAMKLTEQPFVVRVETKPKSRWPDIHWTTAVGLGMAATFIVFVIGNMAVNWFQSEITAWQYGNPPTYQCDVNVGHGGISHFIVENLGGHIVIIEVLTDHLDKTKIYVGPVLLGKGATTDVATLRFEDLDHNGLPYMLLTVENSLYLYSNDGTLFHPVIQGGKHA